VTSFFSAEGGPILTKFRRLVQNDVDCGDMAEIETRSRIPIWWTFGQIQWHFIPELCVTLQGVATGGIHCHDSRATLQVAVTWQNQCHDHVTLQGVSIPSAKLKIIFRHIFLS